MSPPGVVMPKRADVSVRLSYEAYRLAKTVSSWKDISLTDYISGLVLAAARKDFEKMNKEAARHHEQAEGQDP